MTRQQLIEDIRYVISKHKVHSSIDIDRSNTICLYWNGLKNYIQVEGFDTENIYIRKYIKYSEVKNVPIMKLHNAPYKIVRKLHKFLISYYPINK
jgi:hypothetical protein